MPGAGFSAGVGAVKPVDIGKQNQDIGADHGGDPAGQAVVFAEPDLVGGNGVVLVDQRHRAKTQQCRERVAGVQVAAPVIAVVQCQKDLRDGHALAPQHLFVGMRQAYHAGGRRRLFLFELEIAAGKSQVPSAEGDGARRDDDDILPAFPASGQVGGQGLQPSPVKGAPLGVDEQSRSDLDDDAAPGLQAGSMLFCGHGA